VAQKELPTNKSLTLEGTAKIFGVILLNIYAEDQAIQQDVANCMGFIISKHKLLLE